MIKGCNIFGGQKLAALWADALSCKKEKISRAERSWMNPLNTLHEEIHYSFTKLCIYCFFRLVRFLYALRLESRKKLSAWS